MNIRRRRLVITHKKPMLMPLRLARHKLQPRAAVLVRRALPRAGPLPPGADQRAHVACLVRRVRDHQVDVDDGFAGHVGDGGAAGVGDDEGARAEGGADAVREAGEVRWVGGVVGDDGEGGWAGAVGDAGDDVVDGRVVGEGCCGEFWGGHFGWELLVGSLLLALCGSKVGIISR